MQFDMIIGLIIGYDFGQYGDEVLANIAYFAYTASRQRTTVT